MLGVFPRPAGGGSGLLVARFVDAFRPRLNNKVPVFFRSCALFILVILHGKNGIRGVLHSFLNTLCHWTSRRTNKAEGIRYNGVCCSSNVSPFPPGHESRGAGHDRRERGSSPCDQHLPLLHRGEVWFWFLILWNAFLLTGRRP